MNWKDTYLNWTWKVSKGKNPWKNSKNRARVPPSYPSNCPPLMNENYKTIYRFSIVTASRRNIWRRQLAAHNNIGLPRSRSDAVMCIAALRRHHFYYWRPCLDTVTFSLGRHHFCSWHRHKIALDAVRYCSQQGKLRFCRFLHFYTPKTSKMLLFPEFTPKVPKITKGTI